MEDRSVIMGLIVAVATLFGIGYWLDRRQQKRWRARHEEEQRRLHRFWRERRDYDDE